MGTSQSNHLASRNHYRVNEIQWEEPSAGPSTIWAPQYNGAPPDELLLLKIAQSVPRTETGWMNAVQETARRLNMSYEQAAEVLQPYF